MLNYIPFLWSVFFNKIGASNLFNLTLDITDSCNSRCNICNIWKKTEKFDLNPDKFEEILKNSKNLRKLKMIIIGGGEPFLRPDLLKRIIQIFDKYTKPLQLRITTNGLLSEQIGVFIEEIIPTIKSKIGIKISLDGFNSIYEKVRGISHGDEKVKRTIEILQNLQKKSLLYKKNLSIGIGLTVNSLNISQLNDIFNYAKEKHIGFFYKPILKGGRFLNPDLDQKLFINDPKDKEMLIKFNHSLLYYIKTERSFTERLSYSLFYKYFNKLLSDENPKLKCGALRNSIYIIPNGDIFSCLLGETISGNIYSQPFDTFWNSKNLKKIRKSMENQDCSCLTPCDSIPSLIVDKISWILF